MISDYLSKDLKSWVDKQVSVFEVWKVQGLIRDVSPTHVLFMIWAVTQTYADFQTQIKAVLGTKTIDKAEFDKAVATITEVMFEVSEHVSSVGNKKIDQMVRFYLIYLNNVI